MIGKRARPQQGKPKESRVSLLITISWILILGWLGFLGYYWRSGYLRASSNPTFVYVDSVLNSTEVSLRGRLKQIHMAIPVEHLPGGPGPIHVNHIPHREVQSSLIPPLPPADIHVTFSTDCTPYQDWQSLVLFHSATVVGQPGPITRIASGCDDQKKAELTSLYRKLYPNYHVHFTPDFKKDEKSQKSYDFYNKPRGMQHWLKYADPPIPEDTVIALLDPDMIFVRPLTTKMRGQPNNLHGKYIKPEEVMEKVGPGMPVAQMYGLGAPWTNDNHAKFNRGKICGEGSPCLVPNDQFGSRHYAVGPPYLVHKGDMVRLADRWTEFVPRVYEGYPYLLAEMYAYSMAAAHENLPHLQMEHFMVSNTDAGGEGWPLVDVLPDACIPPVDGIFFPGVPLPTVVHYCQNYRAGLIGFAKRQANKQMFSCEAPLLVEPPLDLDKSDFRVHHTKKEKQSQVQTKRNSFSLCIIHRAINAALIDYKERMCDPSTQFVNYNKTYNVLPSGR